MTGQQAINLLMLRLGKRTDVNLRATILLEMVLAQETELEAKGTKPWFLQVDSTTELATTAGQETVDLSVLARPYLGVSEEWGGFWYDTGSTDEASKWRKIGRKAFGMLQVQAENGYSPDTWKYDLVNGKLYIRPIPDEVVAVRAMYYGKDTAPADDTNTNLWLTHAPDLLIGETGLAVATHHTRDYDAIQLFTVTRDKARARMIAENAMYEMNDMQLTMGDD